MQITNSPDIQFLEFSPTWDLSGPLPAISVVNQSAGTGLANVLWWFIAKSPTQTLIHEGSELTPDITGSWNTHSLNDNWPRPFGQIEWSGAPYELTLYAKDSAGNIYSLTKSATICRPSGNTQLSKNYYGVATVRLQVKCEQARIFFEDTTNKSYNGIDGTRISSVLKVVYPIDETGAIPDPFIATNFSTILVPISYNSDNYQYVQDTVYEYEVDDDIYVRIKYQSRSKNGATAISFPVLCNIDLCPLVCEVTKLVNDIEIGNCSNMQEANQKLSLINPKLMLAMLGKQEPLCGIDVAALVEDIKKIGGFICDCCNAPTGIIPSTSAIVDGYSFSVNTVCGDIAGTVTQNGPNIIFNLQDKSYVFDILADSPQDITAFEVIPETSGCTKYYRLRVKGLTLAEEILNTIQSSAGLVNLFNSIVQEGSGDFELFVDGGCIFDSSSTCDFVFTLSNIPINTTFALLTNIKIGSTVRPTNFAFNLTNLPALQTYLNGLGLGAFVVTNPSGQTVEISSTTNPNDIQNVNYKISGTTFPAAMTKTCTGYIGLDPNAVVQNIIDYLCNLDDSQIITSQEYVISYVNNLGAKIDVTVEQGSTLAFLIQALIDANNNNATNIGKTATVTCENLKNQFPQNNLEIAPTDFIMGTRGGACGQLPLLDVFKYALTAGRMDAATKELFCAFVADCGAGLSCAPYNYFEVIVTLFDETCAPITGIEYSLS